MVRVGIAETDNSDNLVYYSQDISTSTGAQSTSVFTPNISDGSYTALVQYYNFGSITTGVIPFKESYVYTDFTVSGGVITETTSNEFYNYLAESPLEESCSLIDVRCGIVNGFYALFVPEVESLDRLISLRDTLDSKMPFAYVSDFASIVTSIFTQATTQNIEVTYDFAGLGDLTLISTDMLSDAPHAATIKGILEALLWAMFGLQMYRRTLRIFDTNVSHNSTSL